MDIRKVVLQCIGIGFCLLLISCGSPREQYTLAGKSWNDVVADAKGSELHWYMWGGSDVINRFVEESIGQRLQDEYDVRLVVNPVPDIALIVARIETEQTLGEAKYGSADLLWINGENFRTLKEQDLLFGPYLEFLPNSRYITVDSPLYQYDFGYPTQGYESPYGAAQFVLVYDKARVTNPPKTIEELLQWIQENPGRFSYPSLPDFTGSAFIRHIIYYAAEDLSVLQEPFTESAYAPIRDRAFEILEELEPYLWEEGKFYPANLLQLNDLFANGSVDMSMTYQANDVAVHIENGQFPDTAQAYVLESGTIGNVHFVGIPINAENIAASLVAANLILDPAVQLEKIEHWGDLSVLCYECLPENWKSKFDALQTHPSSVSESELERVRLPEIGADWVVAIEKDWNKRILND